MKTLIFLFRTKLVIVCFLLLAATNCTDPVQEDFTNASLASYQKDDDWTRFLEQSFYDASIIVPNRGSIQDAINEAKPGDAIYIEPGVYKEDITVDKPDLKLIGLVSKGDKVVIEARDNGNSITTSGNGANIEIFNIEYTRQNRSFSSGRVPGGANRSTGYCKITRKEIAQKIAHYEFEVRLGHGQYDVVKIHRVVREQRPYKPVRTEGAIFMMHGSALKFESIFLRPGLDNPTPETSSAMYLASKNVDVWGLDFAWTQVPLQTTDFGFMKEWGLDRDVDHALAAMSVARLIRGLTSQGLDRLNILGYSYGVAIAYAAAGRETQQHPILRDVKGLVAVDQVMKYAPADETSRQTVCNTVAEVKQALDNGIYQSSSGAGFAQFGNLASTSPNASSPIFPTFTNYQAALFIGTSTFQLGNPPAPFWHFVGGQFSGGVPSGLLYTDVNRWLKLMTTLPPYQPQRAIYESRLCICNEVDVSIDDHLGKISVPILYIGAGGAFGTLGEYTSSITKSNDVTSHNVTVTTDRAIDFGHGDLFVGNDADDLVWKVLYQWLLKHNSYSFL